MPPINRRSHKKSRQGCAECKKRHMKCDESHPTCVNCSTAGMKCSFQAEDGPRSPAVPSPIPTQTSMLPSFSELLSHQAHLPSPADSADLTAEKSVDRSSSLFRPSTDLNLEQIELIHHFVTCTYKTFADNAEQEHLWQITAVHDAMKFSFVMYGLLSITALHLAHDIPEKKSHYHNRAAEYEALALRDYNLAVPSIFHSETHLERFVPVLLFAGLLSIYLYAEPANFSKRTLNDYLEQMAEYVRISKGNKLIVLKLFPSIAKSEYACLVDLKMPREEELQGLPSGWYKLSDLMSEKVPWNEVYSGAIKMLQRFYESGNASPKSRTQVFHCRAWFSTVPESYHALLDQRRPEALVILAYYAAILDNFRTHWAIGETGLYLVRVIHDYLGLYWDEFLAWPLERIQTNTEKLNRSKDTSARA